MSKIVISMIIAAMMLAGCGVSEDVSQMPTEATTPATEPAVHFAQGQAVFVVYDIGDGLLGMRRLFVVEVTGGIVIATTAVPGSGEEGEVLAYSIDICYADEDEAWKVSGMEPME